MVTGVGPTHYADIKADKTPHHVNFHGSTEFAVIAFWDLDKEYDSFKCSRFFIVPHPFKRTIKNCDGTKLDQVLYSSPKDVFFFFKGLKLSKLSDDLSAVADDVLQG